MNKTHSHYFRTLKIVNVAEQPLPDQLVIIDVVIETGILVEFFFSIIHFASDLL